MYLAGKLRKQADHAQASCVRERGQGALRAVVRQPVNSKARTPVSISHLSFGMRESPHGNETLAQIATQPCGRSYA